MENVKAWLYHHRIDSLEWKNEDQVREVLGCQGEIKVPDSIWGFRL